MITTLNEWKKAQSKLIKESKELNIFKSEDINDAAALLNQEIGHAPGYFFFGEQEEINKFDDLWKAQKYTEALNMLAATELDINDLASLQAFVISNESKVTNEETILIEEGTGATVTIDTTRSDAKIAKLMSEAERVKKFIDDKVAHLKQQEPIIVSFLNKFGGKDLVISNMYSTGMSDTEYTEGCQLVAHCKFTLSKEYKNPKLLADKFKENWRNLFAENTLGALFNDWKIKGTSVEFQIWVY